MLRHPVWKLLLAQLFILIFTCGCIQRELSPWESEKFLLTESTVMAGEKVDYKEFIYRSKERFVDRSNELSLQLVLEKETFQYGEPITGQLVITNESGRVLIFARPRIFYFEERCSNWPLIGHGCVEMTDFAGRRIFWRGHFRGQQARREDFTILPPGGSCTVNWRLGWEWGEDVLPLHSLPPPPGEYQIAISLGTGSIGPEIGDDYYDVGAWVGVTKPSNVVTLTILPADNR